MKLSMHERRESLKRGVALIPSLLTTASLFCGFFSVVKSLSGEFTTAAWAILLAGIFDLLDGRVARLAQMESQFGIEYDSLVDLTSFGLAPGILMYTWSLYGLKQLGWLAAFLFFACGALRLARFNVQHDNVEEKFFEGLPIPMAAYFLATAVIFYQHHFFFPPERSYLFAFVTMGLGLLMVSTIHYRSAKTIALRGRISFFLLVIVVIGIVIVALKPEVTMFSLVALYVVSGVVEEIVTLRQSRRLVERLRTHPEEKPEEAKEPKEDSPSFLQ